MSKITNTEKLPPEVLLVGALRAQETGHSDILAMEANGQQELATANCYLPRSMGIGGQGTLVRKQLESYGIQFHEIQFHKGVPTTDEDPLFIRVTLPAGWKIAPTNHSMHSDLLDDKGRQRASIFYKAAYYDRRADMTLCRRYAVSLYQERLEDASGMVTSYRAAITDCGKPIHWVRSWVARNYEDGDACDKECQAYLNEHFPKWQDVTAYWED